MAPLSAPRRPVVARIRGMCNRRKRHSTPTLISAPMLERSHKVHPEPKRPGWFIYNCCVLASDSLFINQKGKGSIYDLVVGLSETSNDLLVSPLVVSDDLNYLIRRFAHLLSLCGVLLPEYAASEDKKEKDCSDQCLLGRTRRKEKSNSKATCGERKTGYGQVGQQRKIGSHGILGCYLGFRSTLTTLTVPLLPPSWVVQAFFPAWTEICLTSG